MNTNARFQAQANSWNSTLLMEQFISSQCLTHRNPPRSQRVRNPIITRWVHGTDGSSYIHLYRAKYTTFLSCLALCSICCWSDDEAASKPRTSRWYSWTPKNNMNTIRAKSTTVTYIPVGLLGRSERSPKRFICGSGPINAAKSDQHIEQKV